MDSTLSIISTVRITQILIDEGWEFIDNGYNEILYVVNKSTDEKVEFKSPSDFVKWLFMQEHRYF